MDTNHVGRYCFVTHAPPVRFLRWSGHGVIWRSVPLRLRTRKLAGQTRQDHGL